MENPSTTPVVTPTITTGSSNKLPLIIGGLIAVLILLLVFFGWNLFGGKMFVQNSGSAANTPASSPSASDPAMVKLPIPVEDPTNSIDEVSIMYIFRGKIAKAEITPTGFLQLELDIPTPGSPKTLLFTKVTSSLWIIDANEVTRPAKPEEFAAGQNVQLGASYALKSQEHAPGIWRGSWITIQNDAD